MIDWFHDLHLRIEEARRQVHHCYSFVECGDSVKLALAVREDGSYAQLQILWVQILSETIGQALRCASYDFVVVLDGRQVTDEVWLHRSTVRCPERSANESKLQVLWLFIGNRKKCLIGTSVDQLRAEQAVGLLWEGCLYGHFQVGALHVRCVCLALHDIVFVYFDNLRLKRLVVS